MINNHGKVALANIREADFPQYFGEWLKRRREELNLTQAQLAQQACCAVFTIRKIESGERRPSKQLAELLAQSLQISTENQATFVRVARGGLGIDRLVYPENLPTVDLPPTEKFYQVRGNLPRSLTPFVGREKERTEIGKLLRDPECSLLTLVGPGGVGKTRLALQAGTDLTAVFPDGVYFVSLAAIDQVDLAPAVISSALQLPLSPKADHQAQLLEALAPKEMLLILDNLEHLHGITALIVDLLTQAASLTLLATSRERLRVDGEWLFPVEGLPTCKSSTPLVNGRSVSSDLFIQNARRLQPEFHPDPVQQEAVEQICWLLEGLPLAIELAAAWVQLLPCTEIVREIQRDLDFLSEDRPGASTRHASMRVVFDHSWNLLSAEEQSIFRKLSVFQGSFEREAAQDVAGANLAQLRVLLDKSLIRRSSPDRYDLHELTRQYAYEKLVEAGEDSQVRDQALLYYQNLAEAIAPEIQGEVDPVCIQHLEEEMENLRAALDWAITSRQVEVGMRLAWALFNLWYWYNHHTQEARHYLEALLSAAKGVPDLPAGLVGNLLYGTGVIASLQLDLPHAEAFLTRSLEIYQSIGDQHGQAAVLNSLGVIAIDYQDFPKARHLFEASLAIKRELGENLVTLLNNLGMLAYYQGDYTKAMDYLRECLQIARESHNRDWIAVSLGSLGEVELQLGDHQRAMAHYLESLRIQQEIGDKGGIVYSLEGLAGCYAEEHPYLAASLLGAAATLRKTLGAPLRQVEERNHQHAIALARTALGEGTFQSAWQEGASISIEALIQEVLQQTAG